MRHFYKITNIGKVFLFMIKGDWTEKAFVYRIYFLVDLGSSWLTQQSKILIRTKHPHWSRKLITRLIKLVNRNGNWAQSFRKREKENFICMKVEVGWMCFLGLTISFRIMRVLEFFSLMFHWRKWLLALIFFYIEVKFKEK